jgi:hypothetical protein
MEYLNNQWERRDRGQYMLLWRCWNWYVKKRWKIFFLLSTSMIFDAELNSLSADLKFCFALRLNQDRDPQLSELVPIKFLLSRIRLDIFIFIISFFHFKSVTVLSSFIFSLMYALLILSIVHRLRRRISYDVFQIHSFHHTWLFLQQQVLVFLMSSNNDTRFQTQLIMKMERKREIHLFFSCSCRTQENGGT